MKKKNLTRHTPAFKAKVALAAVREHESIAELSKRYGVHANQIYKWKRDFVERAPQAFERDAASAASSDSTEREKELLKKIGELIMERDFLERGLDRRR
jgi:transposase